jgi:hypothetical protein
VTTITSIPSTTIITSTTSIPSTTIITSPTSIPSTEIIEPTTIACSNTSYGTVPSTYTSFTVQVSSLISIGIIYNSQFAVFGFQFNYNSSTSSFFGVSQSALSSSGYNPILVTISLEGSYIGSVTTCCGADIDSLQFTLCTNSNNCTILSMYGKIGGTCETVNGNIQEISGYIDTTNGPPFYNTYMKYIVFSIC